MYLHLFNPLASLQGFQLDCRLANQLDCQPEVYPQVEYRPEVFQLVASLQAVFQPEEFPLVVCQPEECLPEEFPLVVCRQVVCQQQVALRPRLQPFDGHDGQLPSACRLLKPLGLL